MSLSLVSLLHGGREEMERAKFGKKVVLSQLQKRPLPCFPVCLLDTRPGESHRTITTQDPYQVLHLLTAQEG